jgi:3-phenylpropionate/trans-cinnamate dioxygenase ferredoxin subunit
VEGRSREPAGEPAGTVVALFHVDGQWLAVEDRCTHQAARLSEGPVVGAEVFCPRHAARFCLRSGRALSPPATEPLRVYEVRVEAGAVWVRPG